MKQLPILFAESKAFEANVQTNLLTTVAPGVVIIGGALVAVVGYGASIALFTAGLGAGGGQRYVAAMGRDPCRLNRCCLLYHSA